MDDAHHEQDGGGGMKMSYWRFGAMIATAVVIMYWVMFIPTWDAEHVEWSESRAYMSITMGGVMALVMLGWMLNMYRNRKANIAIVVVAVLALATSITLDRSQIAIEDTAYMNSMIPHHSMAILRSERAQIEDVRVCELAVSISEAQRREIREMWWLVDDIEENGIADTVEEAEERPVPEFEVSALRDCPTE
jgi:FlaA1/EpsC-like NDP-sugar epimerase